MEPAAAGEDEVHAVSASEAMHGTIASSAGQGSWPVIDAAARNVASPANLCMPASGSTLVQGAQAAIGAPANGINATGRTGDRGALVRASAGACSGGLTSASGAALAGEAVVASPVQPLGTGSTATPALARKRASSGSVALHNPASARADMPSAPRADASHSRMGSAAEAKCPRQLKLSDIWRLFLAFVPFSSRATSRHLWLRRYA